MPARSRSDDNSEDVFVPMLTTVVDIASKSAKSHVEAARAIQTLEAKIDINNTSINTLGGAISNDVGALKTAVSAEIASIRASVSADVAALRSDVALLKQSVDNLDRSVHALTSISVPSAFADTIRNPQTLLILAALVASLLGLRLTMPTFPTTSVVGTQQSEVVP